MILQDKFHIEIRRDSFQWKSFVGLLIIRLERLEVFDSEVKSKLWKVIEKACLINTVYKQKSYIAMSISWPCWPVRAILRDKLAYKMRTDCEYTIWEVFKNESVSCFEKQCQPIFSNSQVTRSVRGKANGKNSWQKQLAYFEKHLKLARKETLKFTSKKAKFYLFFFKFCLRMV